MPAVCVCLSGQGRRALLLLCVLVSGLGRERRLTARGGGELHSLRRLFYLSINNVYVAILVYQDIARNNVPHLVLAIDIATYFKCLFETQRCHVSVYSNLRCWLCIRHSRLSHYWLYHSSIKTSKTMERVCRIREEDIMHNYFTKLCNNTSTIEKIIYLIDYGFSNIGVIFIATRSWHT